MLRGDDVVKPLIKFQTVQYSLLFPLVLKA